MSRIDTNLPLRVLKLERGCHSAVLAAARPKARRSARYFGAVTSSRELLLRQPRSVQRQDAARYFGAVTGSRQLRLGQRWDSRVPALLKRTVDDAQVVAEFMG